MRFLIGLGLLGLIGCASTKEYALGEKFGDELFTNLVMMCGQQLQAPMTACICTVSTLEKLDIAGHTPVKEDFKRAAAKCGALGHIEEEVEETEEEVYR